MMATASTNTRTSTERMSKRQCRYQCRCHHVTICMILLSFMMMMDLASSFSTIRSSSTSTSIRTIPTVTTSTRTTTLSMSMSMPKSPLRGISNRFSNRVDGIRKKYSTSTPTSKSSASSASSLKSLLLFDMEDNNDTSNNNKIGKELPFDTKVDKILHKLQNIPPLLQLLILLSMYILHLLVLTQHSILFPFQLIPNDKGWFQSIGLDSVAGIFSFISIGLLRKRQLKKNDGRVTIPSLFSGVYDHQVVETLTGSKKGTNENGDNEHEHGNEHDNDNDNEHDEVIIQKKLKKRTTSSIPAPWKFPLRQENVPSPRITSTVALTLLVSAYFFTGRLASMVELYLYAMAGLGVPMTIAMHRSLVVLGGHLAWVGIGSGILGIVLRPQPFFGGGNKLFVVEKDDIVNVNANVKSNSNSNNINSNTYKSDDDDLVNDDETTVIEMKKQKYKWFSNKWNSNWLWWTLSGYFISSWFFNIADFLNQVILPAHVFELAGEGVVSQLINPENNDIAASLVGYIAPCISAPWWEEVLYRGFLLPALTLQMKFWPAVFVSGIVFSVHHVSTTGAIPLAILGWTWAALYAKSGNLMVTILIHAMWNSRVFLGSWLGL